MVMPVLVKPLTQQEWEQRVLETAQQSLNEELYMKFHSFFVQRLNFCEAKRECIERFTDSLFFGKPMPTAPEMSILGEKWKSFLIEILIWKVQ